MAHRERKQLNFSTIVDFSLLKQGIFFITLRQVKSPDTSLKIRCIGAFFLPAFITKDSQQGDASAYSISFFSGALDGASFGRVLLLATGMNRLANLFSPRLRT